MVASLSKPTGGDGGEEIFMSSVAGSIRGKQESSSLSTSAMKRTSPASSYACTVTPPMSLPSRGWGDSGSEGCGSRHLSGFSCHSIGDTVSSNGSCSSTSRSTHDSGSVCGHGGAGGAGAGGSLRSSAGADCEGRQLKQFNLSDGFSSAEEETWGSEGEIEETIVAGRRRALVTLGPSKHLGANSSSSSSSSRAACAEEEDGEGDGEARGLLVRGGSRAAMSGAAVSGAPVCAGVGLVPGVGSRRKAAVGAGRAKRRTSSGAGRRDAAAAGRGTSGSTCGIRGSGGGGGGCCARGVSSSGAGERCGGRGRGGGGREAGSSHPLKVSRRLFIEIENKASEPPPPRRAPPPDRRWRADRRHRLGAAVRGLDSNARTRRLGGGAHGNADDGQGDSDDEPMCGCAERCLRVVDAWYRTLTGSTARVKFSELDQAVPLSIP